MEMESLAAASSSSLSAPQQTSHNDELFMHQRLLFSHSLKDLKSLRKQLYSAAEYFEQSYSNKDGCKLMVVDTLKDYTVKALVNTVDHLGSMAFKVESLLDERIGQFRGFQLRLSSLEQRTRTCQEVIDRNAHFQQSLIIKTPTHHKRYIFPVADTTPAAALHQTAKTFHSCSLYAAEDDLRQYRNGTNSIDCFAKADQPTTNRPTSPFVRKRRSSSLLLQSSASPQFFSFTRTASNKEIEKQRVSPLHFPLMRSGSVMSRSSSPNPFSIAKRYPSEPRRSNSLVVHAEREMTKDMEQYASKSKRLFKALLSMRKPKKDATLYKYLDEN